MSTSVPRGMTRRHFLTHLAGASSWAVPAMALTRSLRAHADTLRRNRKSAILLWMGGGPSTLDLWDLKPDTATGGPFRAISTSGDMQISEHLPLIAQQMRHLSVVRSMSTKEADHGRARYYMHTGYVPDPTIDHPSYGSVVAHQLADQRPELTLPPFVSIGGDSVGPGFLGMSWAPFVVAANGRLRNLKMGVSPSRLRQRLRMLNFIEGRFIAQDRGQAAQDHEEVLQKTYGLLTSKQRDAFQYQREKPAILDRYGDSNFGRGCLMARRLVEVGVPFVEVNLSGWDNHQNIFSTLQNDKLPVLDQAMSALVEDLVQRGMWEDTVVIWLGEFGRTPRINDRAGRDHWARSWSVVVGGADFQGGLTIGQTSSDGSQVETEPYTSHHLMASVCRALGISLETTFTSRNGRPQRIANYQGTVIDGLFT